MVTTAALLIAVLCTAVVTGVFFLILVKKDSLENQLKNELADLEARCRGFEQRLSAIDAHTIDYANSLGSDGAQALGTLREMLKSVRAAIDEAGSLLATKDYGAMQQAEMILRGKISPNANAVDAVIGSTGLPAVNLASNWDAEMETLLMRVGGRLSHAAAQARIDGVPRRKKAKSTLSSLFHAKIFTGRTKPFDW